MTQEDLDIEALEVIEIGCHHEKQHQEFTLYRHQIYSGKQSFISKI